MINNNVASHPAHDRPTITAVFELNGFIAILWSWQCMHAIPKKLLKVFNILSTQVQSRHMAGFRA